MATTRRIFAFNSFHVRQMLWNNRSLSVDQSAAGGDELTFSSPRRSLTKTDSQQTASFRSTPIVAAIAVITLPRYRNFPSLANNPIRLHELPLCRLNKDSSRRQTSCKRARSSAKTESFAVRWALSCPISTSPARAAQPVGQRTPTAT